MTIRALISWTAVWLAGCAISMPRVCDVTGPPPPGFACTTELEGAIVCSSGSGYTCTRDACWALFVDGPCAAGVGVDGGSDGGRDGGADDGGTDAGSCGSAAGCFPGEAGNERCTGSVRERCEGGCWNMRGTCEDGGVFVCGAGGAPPVDPCTADVEDVMICPSGTGSGSGYRCTATGCWSAFYDGPCSSPFMGTCPFGGASCSAGEVGLERCAGRIRERCNSGCFTPVGLCPRDGG